ncbi:protease modulator HflC [Paenibacillus amylolyticus]|uniref:protease modulator HflC n=1 Tax=Paenibacillus amylolyticus TaxID=1451 RepID=UPI003397FD9B
MEELVSELRNIKIPMVYKVFFIGLVLLCMAYLLFTFKVKENEYAVITRFGEIISVKANAGLSAKVPFLDKVSYLPREQKLYTSKSTSILTKDKKPMMVDNYTVWRITDVTRFVKSVQNVKSAEERIDAAVYNTVRRKLSESEYGEIINAAEKNTDTETKNSSMNEKGSGRIDLNVSITDEVRRLMEKDYGVAIVDIKIKSTDLPEENKNSVFKRMISERDSIAANYLSEGDEEARNKTSQADRQARVIESEGNLAAKEIIADGEEQAAKIYNQAYSKDPAFYELYRTLQSYTTSLQGEPVIMIPSDSPYARILTGELE